MSEVISFVNAIKSGKNFSNKIKISLILGLRAFQKLFPISIAKIFDYPGKLMIIETDVPFRIGTLGDFIVFSSLWEPQVRNVFRFHKDMIFLDVGAHIGKYTIRAASKIGKNGKIISIEPNEDNFRILIQNLKLNQIKNCIPLNVAAYSNDTELELFVGSDSAKHSIVEKLDRGSKKVKARALDNVLSELNIKKVDFIKIDVEGAEYDVIKGLEKTLTNQNPKLFIEILKKDQEKVLNYLKQKGYHEHVLYQLVTFKEGLMYYFLDKKQ